MSCNTGVHNAISKILGDKAWFKYKQGDKFISIIDTPSKKINKYRSIGVANDTSKFINKEVNKHYPGIGDIVYPEFYQGRGIVTIAPTNKQLDLINSTDELEKQEILKEILQDDINKEFKNKDFFMGDEALKEQNEKVEVDDLPTIELTC